MTEERPFYDRKRPAHQAVIEDFNRSRIVFLTVCTDKRKSILGDEIIHKLLVECWKKANAWVVGRYVMMPDHLHLFYSPVGMEYPPLKVWVNYWKSLAAKAWPHPDVGKVWQRNFWDTQLRQGESYSEKWHYVMNNPVRAELVEIASSWPYQGEICELQWHD